MLTAHQMFLPKLVTSNYLQSLQVLLSTGKCCLESELSGHQFGQNLKLFNFELFYTTIVFYKQYK